MTNRRVRTTLALITCTFLGGSVAHAQATRTWVSGVGDDVNPCSRTAPCKTFAGAISKTAAGGEISVLDPGGFGGVTITKSITLNGAGEHGSILATLSANGVIINAGATDVITLRNIQINGAGTGNNGIRFLAGAALIVDNVTVQGFSSGIETFAGNTTITNASFTNNRAYAIHAQGGSVTVENSMIASNNVAVQASGASTVRLSNNGVYNNLTGFGCGTGTLASAGNNRKANNTGGTVPVCAPSGTVTIQ